MDASHTSSFKSRTRDEWIVWVSPGRNALHRPSRTFANPHGRPPHSTRQAQFTHHSIMRHVQNDHSRDDWWSLPWMFQLARVWKRGPGRSRALPARLAGAARPHTWVEVTEAPTERGARPAGRSCCCSTQAARRIGSKSAWAREIALGALGS